MGSDNNSSRKDPAWKYAHLVDPSNTNDFACNFCGKVTKGGVYRVKQHLIGGFRTAKACLECPPDVRKEIKDYMTKKAGIKENYDILTMQDSADENGASDEDELLISYVSRSRRAAGSSKDSHFVKKKPKLKGLVNLDHTEQGQKMRQTAIYKGFKKILRERERVEILLGGCMMLVYHLMPLA